MERTITEEFNKILEVQQSKYKRVWEFSWGVADLFYTTDVVAGIDDTKEPEYVEEMINRQKPLDQVLRLLCLMSLAQGGLKSKLYDQFRRDIVQV